jgi:NAD-dependent deacetylase
VDTRVPVVTDDTEHAPGIERAAAAIHPDDHVVALTGAGVSTASGIPNLRSDGGIWDRFDPADFRIGRFRRDPAGFWTQRVDLHDAVNLESTPVSATAEHDLRMDVTEALPGLLDAVTCGRSGRDADGQ